MRHGQFMHLKPTLGFVVTVGKGNTGQPGQVRARKKMQSLGTINIALVKALAGITMTKAWVVTMMEYWSL